MQSVNGKTITLTKGDTFIAMVTITDGDGNIYTPQEGDSIRFAAKQNYEDYSPVIVKDIPTDTMTLTIESGDTKPLAVGTYVFDVQLTYADGRVDTFIDKGKLKLTEEVD